MQILYKISIILTVLCCFLICSPRGESAEWFKMTALQLELTSNYDDNILRYSDRDIDRFLNRDEYYPSKITTYDDWKNEFRVKAYFETASLFNYPFKIKYFGKFAHYYRNPFRNYTNHTFLLNQNFSKRLEVHFKYYYMPDYYLREYRDRDLNEYQSCSFDNTQFRLGISYRLAKMTELTLQAQYEQIYYNEHFTEYDSDLYLYEAILNHNFSWDWRCQFSFGYCISDNIGYTPSTISAEPSPFEEDTEYGESSYEEEEYQIEIRRRQRKLWGSDTWFTLQYKLRHRIYTTGNSLQSDPYHSARLDDRHRIIFEINRDITPHLEITIGYTYQWRTTESDYQPVIDAKEFQQHIYSVTFNYRFL